MKLKHHWENCRRRKIQLSDFFQQSLMLILVPRAAWIRCGESGTPSNDIYKRWSSRRYGLGCHAPKGMICPRSKPQGRPRVNFNASQWHGSTVQWKDTWVWVHVIAETATCPFVIVPQMGLIRTHKLSDTKVSLATSLALMYNSGGLFMSFCYIISSAMGYSWHTVISPDQLWVVFAILWYYPISYGLFMTRYDTIPSSMGYSYATRYEVFMPSCDSTRLRYMPYGVFTLWAYPIMCGIFTLWAFPIRCGYSLCELFPSGVGYSLCELFPSCVEYLLCELFPSGVGYSLCEPIPWGVGYLLWEIIPSGVGYSLCEPISSGVWVFTLWAYPVRCGVSTLWAYPIRCLCIHFVSLSRQVRGIHFVSISHQALGVHFASLSTQVWVIHFVVISHQVWGIHSAGLSHQVLGIHCVSLSLQVWSIHFVTLSHQVWSIQCVSMSH